MEILSSGILTHQPEISVISLGLLIFTGLFLFIGVYWLYEIISKTEKFSIGAIVFTVIGLLFGIGLISYIKDETYEYEQMKVIVTDWNVVYEDGWEVVDQDGKIVILERRLETK